MRAGLTRDRVVAAGGDLADEIGFAHVTVSELARRLGVRTASLYSHVAGSDDLRTEIALRALAETADLTADALAGRSGREALAALADVHREYARQHPGRYDASRLRLDPETAAASAGVRHSELTRAVLRGYALEGEEQVHAVRLIGSTLHGFIALEASGGFDHSRPGPDATWSRLIDGLDRLLRDWP